MLGAEQGKELGLSWEGGWDNQVGLARRWPDPTPPSGMPAPSHPASGTARRRWGETTSMLAQFVLRKHL